MIVSILFRALISLIIILLAIGTTVVSLIIWAMVYPSFLKKHPIDIGSYWDVLKEVWVWD